MYVLGAIFVVFINFLAISESLDAPPRSYETLRGDKFNSLRNFDYLFMPTWRSNAALSLYNLNENDQSTIESMICSDMNSRLSRVLRRFFANNENHERTINVRVYYASRKQRRRVEVYGDGKFDLERTDFSVERRTVIIVHGFLSGGSQSWIKKMEDAFILWDDVNVMVVDWSAVGKTVNYYKAAISTRIVGYEIAKFLKRLVNAMIDATSPHEPKWGKLHLIGHSLGSHISGVAAHDFHKMQNHWRVSRITGLDPARLCFDNVAIEFRLDPTDASFVDVIHTSATIKSTVGFGNSLPSGHVDFYPNGGKRQPGCSQFQGSIFDYIWIPKTPIVQGTCSHGRSYTYFTESLIHAATGNCKFWAHKWDRSYLGALQVIAEFCDPISCTEMGIRAENHPHRGTFFVTTSKKSPFCAKI